MNNQETYVLKAEDLREVWGMFSEYGGLVDRPDETLIAERYAEFDCWLATVKAEAWAKAAECAPEYMPHNPYRTES